MKFATVATIASAQAIVTRQPIGQSLVECPSPVGTACQLSVGGLSLVMIGGEPDVAPVAAAAAPADAAAEAKAPAGDAKKAAVEATAPATAPAAAPDAAPVAAPVAAPAAADKPAEKKDDFSGLKGLEHCPDMNERFTLANGTTLARAYPGAGYNCSNEYGLVQTQAAPSLDHLEHCPDFNERYTLRNGQVMAVPYPKAGFNCNWSLAQVQDGPAAAAKPVAAAKKPEVPIGAPNLDNLEHCPDFNERYTLRNGTDMAVPYPKAGFNCNPAWSLAQTSGPWPANVIPANIAAGATYSAALEHCPDRPERQTLRDGVTKPVAGVNCNADAYPAVAGTPWPYALAQGPWPANVIPANIAAGATYSAALEHCPDRPERQTLRDGVTKPVAGVNCNADAYPAVAGVPWPYALAQAPWAANVVPANIPAGATYPAGLEHCPDLPERQTLRDGLTKPIPGTNCNADVYPGKEGVPAPYH